MRSLRDKYGSHEDEDLTLRYLIDNSEKHARLDSSSVGKESENVWEV